MLRDPKSCQEESRQQLRLEPGKLACVPGAEKAGPSGVMVLAYGKVKRQRGERALATE